MTENVVDSFLGMEAKYWRKAVFHLNINLRPAMLANRWQKMVEKMVKRKRLANRVKPI